MHSVRRPWWQQATALVTVTTGGVITGFNFVPGAAATMTSPTSVPLHLLALEQAAQPGSAMNARAIGGDSADSGTSDALLRSAIVNVAKYYLQIAATRSPAQMEALIWDNTSLNGADHGPSCAAFASLTLELAAQAVGQQSWVSGGKSYPYPLPAWADVRVDTNPASPAVTSVMADAQTHGRWHPVGGGYQPQPGDWVLFEHHVEVVTRYSDGVLATIGADSDPGLTVNAHSYGGSLAADGVVGFVDNGHLDAASLDGTTHSSSSPAAPSKDTGRLADGGGIGSQPDDGFGRAGGADGAGGLGGAGGRTSGRPRRRPAGAGRREPERRADAPLGANGGAAPSHRAAAAQRGSDPQRRADERARRRRAARRRAALTSLGWRSRCQRAHPPRPVSSTASASASSGTAAVPGVVQPAGTNVTAGPVSRSGSQALDDRGVAAAIPGAVPAAAAASGDAASGGRRRPGAAGRSRS